MTRAQDMQGSSGNDEIGTPIGLFKWLDRRFDFNFDAAASLENHLTLDYAAIAGTFHGQTLVSDQDGLTGSWQGKRVFCNPPYSQPLLRKFIEKAIAERNSAEIIVMLVKYDSSTVNGKLLRENFHLEYLPRIKYEGMSSPATFASVIAIVRPDYMAAQ